MTDAISLSNRPQRVAVIGCGFFGQFQISAWRQLDGADIVAVCDQDASRAVTASQLAGDVPFFLNAEEMLRKVSPDVVDIATMPRSHLPLAQLCADFRTAAIIQKPMAMNLVDATKIVNFAKRAGVRMAVHENTRFRRPIREIKKLMSQGAIGTPRYCAVSRRTTYSPFARDPVLRNGERLVLADMGVHVFDVARFLMGPIRSLSCRTLTVTEGLKGDETASALVGFETGAIGVVSCSCVSPLPNAPNLDVLVTVEGTGGSIVLARDSTITLRSGEKIESWTVDVPTPSWGSEHWSVVQDAVLAVCQNWLDAAAGRAPLENSVDDNLAAVAAMEACYISATAGGALVQIEEVLARTRREAGRPLVHA